MRSGSVQRVDVMSGEAATAIASLRLRPHRHGAPPALTARQAQPWCAALAQKRNRRVKDFVKKLEYSTVKPALRALAPWRHVTYGGIRVHCKRYLDGVGRAPGGVGKSYAATIPSGRTQGA
jgi:hypothetical protein